LAAAFRELMGKKEKRARKGQPAAEHAAAPGKRLKGTVRPYVQHILVCTDRKSKQCKKGGPVVLKAFEKAIKGRRLGRQVMVTEIGHIGGCSLGPNVIIYPEGVWYGRVMPDDVDEIIDEHLLAGRVVERLLRGQRQDDPCGGCIIARPLVNAAREAVESLN
jgi:(2Fe-2S) ferredoxin